MSARNRVCLYLPIAILVIVSLAGTAQANPVYPPPVEAFAPVYLVVAVVNYPVNLLLYWAFSGFATRLFRDDSRHRFDPPDRTIRLLTAALAITLFGAFVDVFCFFYYWMILPFGILTPLTLIFLSVWAVAMFFQKMRPMTALGVGALMGLVNFLCWSVLVPFFIILKILMLGAPAILFLYSLAFLAVSFDHFFYEARYTSAVRPREERGRPGRPIVGTRHPRLENATILYVPGHEPGKNT